MSSYKDVKAWIRGMDLVDAVYNAVRTFPSSELFLLSQQMRSAAISIPNIAEGKGRWTTRDYRHFVIQARGSTLELETEILIATRQKFLDLQTGVVAATDGRSRALDQRVDQLSRLMRGRGLRPET